MGFNLSQIINKFVPTQEQGAIGWENPLGTPQGQIQVGNSEGLLQYYARKDLLFDKNVGEVTANSTASYGVIVTTPNSAIGKRQFAQKIIFSANQSGIMSLMYTRDDINNVGSTRYMYIRVGANQPLQLNLFGGAWSKEGSYLQVLFKPDTAPALCNASILYVEV